MAPPSYAAAALTYLLVIMKVVSDVVPTCNPLYGAPSTKDCAWLVNQLQRGWPQSAIFDDHFFFAMRGTPKPAEISDEQYRTSFEVPRIVQHGECIMGLSPMIYSEGVAWDTGTFASMRSPGLRIIEKCSGTYTTVKEGGHIAVGDGLKIILTLFAPDSHMDQVYKSIQLLNADMCARVARNAAVAGSNVGGYQECSQPLDNDDFYDFLDQVFYGKINLCRGSDGCRCVPDPSNKTICADPVSNDTTYGSSGVTS